MSRRVLRPAAPLLILVIILLLVNTLSPEGQTGPSRPETETAAAVIPSQSPPTASRPPILQATILPTSTATAAPQSNTPEAAGTLTLFGPPPAATLVHDGVATFYWGYSEPLPANHQLVLTLRQNNQVWTRHPLTSPNLGGAFQVQVNFSEMELSAGTAVWQVELQLIEAKTVLLSSEERTFILIGE